MNEFEQKKTFWQSLTKQQKWGLGFLSFFTLIILLFWFMQLRQQLIYPFYMGMSPGEYYDSQDLSITEQLGISEEESIAIYQKSKDTDSDGLSDWDELNIYGTSPYLADSDGDNLSDYDEIQAQTDPNCPEGQNCLEDNLVVNEVTGGSNDTVIDPLNNEESDILLEAFGEEPSIDILRSALIEAGANKEELDQISDEDLLSMYAQMMSEN